MHWARFYLAKAGFVGSFGRGVWRLSDKGWHSHAEATNQAHWDEVAPVHLKSYGIEGLLNGLSRIDSIQIAKELAARLKLKARFYQANVLELRSFTSEKYDIVYMSKGVLCWIRDIRQLADTVSYLLLKPGGVFYLMESHPVLSMFDDTTEDLQIKYSYFHQDQPIHFDDEHPDYADTSYVPQNKTYEWTWSLSDIVTALIKSGLTIQFLNEHDRLFYKEVQRHDSSKLLAARQKVEPGSGIRGLRRDSVLLQDRRPAYLTRRECRCGR